MTPSAGVAPGASVAVSGTIGLNGFPDCRLTIGATLQRSTSRLHTPLSAENGSRYTPLITKRRRASKSESARSAAKLWKSWICGLFGPTLPTELLSIDFETVNDPESVSPLASRLLADSHMPL